jgi:hypothetical protein
VVVKDVNFKVNTKNVDFRGQAERKQNMRQGDVEKVGIRISKKKVKEANSKNLFSCKSVESLPPSLFMSEQFKEFKETHGGFKEKDATKMVHDKDFNINIRNNTLSKSIVSKKVFVTPLNVAEKSGPKW